MFFKSNQRNTSIAVGGEGSETNYLVDSRGEKEMKKVSFLIQILEFGLFAVGESSKKYEECGEKGVGGRKCYLTH